MKHQIVTIPYDLATELECVLLSVNDNTAQCLYIDDMTVFEVEEHEITYTDDTISIDTVVIAASYQVEYIEEIVMEGAA